MPRSFIPPLLNEVIVVNEGSMSRGFNKLLYGVIYSKNRLEKVIGCNIKENIVCNNFYKSSEELELTP